MLDRFKSISLRWKIQIVFFTVTLITTIYNRILGAWQMKQQIQLVEEQSGSAELLVAMEEQYQYFLWVAVGETTAQLVVQFSVIMVLARIFVEPILNLTKALKATSEGDFTKSVTQHSQDEIGILERCFNDVMRTLNRIISHVHHSSLHTTQSAYQIASVTHEIELSSDLEAKRSKEVKEATESLHKVSNQVIKSAEDTHEQAIKSAELSREGIDLVQAVIAEMSSVTDGIQKAANQTNVVQEAVESISNTLQEITSIAEQTNLLALNAAIEAARAGENGRGFAVVADEVRALSVRTSDSAGSVREIIERLNNDTQQSHQLMSTLVEDVAANQEKSEKTKRLLSSMQSSIENFVNASQNIFDDTTKQLKKFGHLEDSLMSLFQTLKQNSVKVSNTTHIGESLFNLTQQMESELSGLEFNSELSYEEKVPTDIAERRSSPRALGHLLVQLSAGEDTYEGLSKDISSSGIRIATTAAFQKSQVVKIFVKPPSNSLPDYVQQAPIELEAEVMWTRADSERGFLYGLKFINLDAQRRTEIEKCCEYYLNGNTPKPQTAA